jgi:transposase-like protein
MSHSKGFLSGTCPGNFRKYGRPHDGIQQWRCARCGKVRNKRAPRCLLSHQWKDHGQGDHGYQKQKCEKCGYKRAQRFTGCGMFRSCRWHMCDRMPGILHCKVCARSRG